MLMRHTVHRRSGETFNRGEEREGRKGGFPDSHGWLVDCGGIAFLPNLSKKSESLDTAYSEQSFCGSSSMF